jgi:hypothetical protein
VGDAFVCREGTSTADGKPLGAVVPFECSCVPGPLPSCGTGCDTAFPRVQSGGLSCTEAADGGILCGCAYVTLK